MTSERTCRECGETFEATRRDALYCGGACRTFAYRRRLASADQGGTSEAIRVPVPATVTIRSIGKFDRSQPKAVPASPPPSYVA